MVAKKPVTKKVAGPKTATAKKKPVKSEYAVKFAKEYLYFVKATSPREAEDKAMGEFYEEYPDEYDDPKTVFVRKLVVGRDGRYTNL